MRGEVRRLARVTREMVRSNRNTLFCFGDNMNGAGYGGQAASMRGEPNSVGVPTKWSPRRDPGAYFSDSDWDIGDVRHAIIGAFERMERHLQAGLDVVIPTDGLGTGLAELPQRAPKIAAMIDAAIARLSKQETADSKIKPAHTHAR